MEQPTTPFPAYAVVVPVKRVAVAKSRLAGLGDDVRRDLVAAFAVDTVAAALDCPLVAGLVVVTDEIALVGPLTDLGARVIPDGESGRLNATLVQGAAEAMRLHPGARPVALCADLPALLSEDLAACLRGVPDDGSAFVADAHGVGTTLYTAATRAGFAPRFGPDSRAAHRSAGALELDLAPGSTVRLDVDTPDDLAAAAAAGLGPRTAFTVTRHRLL